MSDHPDDICECGDYRKQHDERGCKFNLQRHNVGHGGAPDCDKFVLVQKQAATDGK